MGTSSEFLKTRVVVGFVKDEGHWTRYAKIYSTEDIRRSLPNLELCSSETYTTEVFGVSWQSSVLSSERDMRATYDFGGWPRQLLAGAERARGLAGLFLISLLLPARATRSRCPLVSPVIHAAGSLYIATQCLDYTCRCSKYKFERHPASIGCHLLFIIEQLSVVSHF